MKLKFFIKYEHKNKHTGNFQVTSSKILDDCPTVYKTVDDNYKTIHGKTRKNLKIYCTFMYMTYIFFCKYIKFSINIWLGGKLVGVQAYIL